MPHSALNFFFGHFLQGFPFLYFLQQSFFAQQTIIGRAVSVRHKSGGNSPGSGFNCMAYKFFPPKINAG
jgi:hypothetical protein